MQRKFKCCNKTARKQRQENVLKAARVEKHVTFRGT